MKFKTEEIQMICAVAFLTASVCKIVLPTHLDWATMATSLAFSCSVLVPKIYKKFKKSP